MNAGLAVDHIPEHSLEAYVRHKLSARHRAGVENHLLLCPTCQTKLLETEEYIRVLRAALEGVNADTGLRLVKKRSRSSTRLRVLGLIFPLSSKHSAT